MIGVLITKENNIVINVSIDVTKGTIIKDTSSRLQIKIKKAVKDATDLDIESVNVRVRNVEEIYTENEEDEIYEEQNEIKKVSETKNNSKKLDENKSNKKVATKNKSK